MTILLTGATGYLGSRVVARLQRRYEGPVRCLVRRGPLCHGASPRLAHPDGGTVEVIEGNLLDARAVERALDGVRRVVHLAASLRGAAADLFLNGVVATDRLSKGIARAGIERLVHVSSLTVYGLADRTPGPLVDESVPLDPHPERRDAYAFVKIWQERIVDTLSARTGVPLVTLRPGALCGADGEEFCARVGLRIGRAIVQLGNQRLPLCHVDHCADAVVHAVLSDQVEPGPYNVLDDDLPTTSEYVRRFRREVEHVPWWRLPYPLALLASYAVERYHHASRGQIPLALTPYRTRNTWRGHRYSNARLKATGWRPTRSTPDVLQEVLGGFRARRATELLTPGRHVEHVR